MKICCILFDAPCTFLPPSTQDGQTISYARMEAEESRIAEASSPDAAGNYPVFVIKNVNHGQVASGENNSCVKEISVLRMTEFQESCPTL